jgi:thiamine pyrophosphokinase
MRVLGVLSGTDMSLEQIGDWASSADVVLAADGGANSLQAVGRAPDVAVGDFDSISSSARTLAREVLFNPDQDCSDCDKLFALADARGYGRVTLCNIEGDAPDHVLATLQSCAKAHADVRLALRRGVAFILKGPCSFEQPMPAGARISLIPLGICENVWLRGTYWQLDGATLSPVGASSLSNRADSGTVSVQMASGCAVLFMLAPELETPHW